MAGPLDDPPEYLLFYLFFGSTEQTAPSRAGYPGKQKGMDLEMTFSQIAPKLDERERKCVQTMYLIIKMQRENLAKKNAENAALKAQIAELRRQLDETERTNQAGDKAFVQLVNRNHTTTRQGVYRFG